MKKKCAKTYMKTFDLSVEAIQMATIEKQVGKNGTTYRITVYSGFDTQGKRIRHRQTYKRNRV